MNEEKTKPLLPGEKDTPCYQLFHTLFLVKVPQIALYSPDYLRTFGVVTSGDKDLDDHLMMSLVDTYLTINSMIEVRRRGYSVGIVGEYDKAYMIVVNHLYDWIDILREPLCYRKPPPIEDIKDLDQLAQDLYPFVSIKLLTQQEKEQKVSQRTYLSRGTKPANLVEGNAAVYSPVLREYIEVYEAKYGRVGLGA